MKAPEYMAHQAEILDIALRLKKLDLEAFQIYVGKAKELASLLDPELFVKANRNLDALKDMAHHLQDAKMGMAESFLKVHSSGVSGFTSGKQKP